MTESELLGVKLEVSLALDHLVDVCLRRIGTSGGDDKRDFVLGKVKGLLHGLSGAVNTTSVRDSARDAVKVAMNEYYRSIGEGRDSGGSYSTRACDIVDRVIMYITSRLDEQKTIEGPDCERFIPR